MEISVKTRKIFKYIAYGTCLIVGSIVLGITAIERTDLFGPLVGWCCLIGEVIVLPSLVIAFDN
jgi:hypothetical protein